MRLNCQQGQLIRQKQWLGIKLESKKNEVIGFSSFKHQTTNYKFQAMPKFKIPMTKTRMFGCLVLGFVWDLVLGVWNF